MKANSGLNQMETLQRDRTGRKQSSSVDVSLPSSGPSRHLHALSSSTLVSDLWNLLACLSVINDHVNACQVFPFEKLGTIGWVREETARNQTSKLLPQKWYLMKQDSQNTGYYDVKEGHSAPRYSSLWYQKKYRVLSEIIQSQYLAGDLIRNQEPFFARVGNAVAEIIEK